MCFQDKHAYEILVEYIIDFTTAEQTPPSLCHKSLSCSKDIPPPPVRIQSAHLSHKTPTITHHHPQLANSTHHIIKETCSITPETPFVLVWLTAPCHEDVQQLDYPLTSNTGWALLYTDRMWVMPFFDRPSLFSASVTRKETNISPICSQWISHQTTVIVSSIVSCITATSSSSSSS